MQLDHLRRLRRIRDLVARREVRTAEELARELHVSRRTVLRDLQVLRRDFGAPLEYDPGERRLVLREPEWDLPRLRLSEGELLALLLARELAEAWRETPVADALESVFRKLQAALTAPVSLDPEWVGEQLSFHFSGRGRVAPAAWRTVLKALRAGRWLAVRYRAAGYERPAALELEPLHLACLEGDWYLLARRRGPEVRMYALRRLESARLLQRRIAPDRQPFDARAWLARRFRRFVAPPGRRPPRARIRFDVATAPWIREREWHPEQRIQEHRDGGLTLSFPMPGVLEARRWVLGWGAGARVLGPPALREAVAEEVARMSGLQRTAGGARSSRTARRTRSTADSPTSREPSALGGRRKRRAGRAAGEAGKAAVGPSGRATSRQRQRSG